MSKFSPKRPPLTKQKYLNDIEFSRLMNRLNEIKKKYPRDTALIFLALATGARAGELLNLTRDDFDFSNLKEPVVFIRGIKNSNSREIPITESLARHLLKLDWPDGKPFNFSHQRLTIIWYRIRLNITTKKFHSLRHTFAVRNFKKTQNIMLIQQTLGHRCIANTQVYSNYLIEEEQMRKLLLG